MIHLGKKLLLFLIGQNDDRENPVEGTLPRSPGQAEAGGESAPSAIKAASAKERRRNEESPGSLPILIFEGITSVVECLPSILSNLVQVPESQERKEGKETATHIIIVYLLS